MSEYDEAWRQGTIIEYEETEWIMLTHCCDIRHNSLENEPCIELVQLDRELKNPDKTYVKGRHPRVLHLSAKQNSRIVIRSRSRRVFVPKSTLLRSSEVKEHLPLDQREHLRFWIGRRYTRVAFADEFNRRFSDAGTHLRNELKKINTDNIFGLYFVEETMGGLQVEISEDEPYEAQLWIVVIGRADSAANEKLELLASEVELESRKNGIDLDVRVLESAGVTLNDFQTAVHWSEHDWMSN